MTTNQTQKGYSLYRRKDSPYWWVKLSLDGRDFSESTKTDNEKKAGKFAQQRIAELRTDNFLPAKTKRTRVEELVEDLFIDYSINGAKSLDDAKTRWNLHLKPFFGHRRASDVSNTLLKTYVSSRHAQGAANGSLNRELSLLKRAFNLGHEAKKLRDVPIFPHLDEPKPRKGFLEDEQYRGIVNAFPELWFRTIAELGRTYGWRVSELQTLQVRQVDLLERTVRLDDSKNGEGRLVIMTDNVFTLLSASLRGKRGEDFAITRNDGKQILDFRVTWHRACVAAGAGRMVCPGCKDAHTLDGKGRCPECSRIWKYKEQRYVGAIFHDLRRTAVRDMVRRGITEKVAMTISGHKTRSVFERYNIVDDKDLRLAAEKMNRREESYEVATLGPKSTSVANTGRLN